MSRLKRLQAQLDAPLLVSSLVNVRYLTGLASSNAALLAEPGGTRLFTDFRYVERAREVPGVELVVTRRDIYAELAELLGGTVQFEPAALTYARYATLADGGLDLVPRAGLVEAMRAIKDESELDAIRRAAAVANAAFERFVEGPFVGTPERELAWRLESLMREHGGEDVSFPVIVASGATGGSAHAVPGDRLVEVGETIVVDFGCRVDGYCSDCTRTLVTGELPDDLRQAYDAVEQAQLVGLTAVRVGADSGEVDAAARDVMEAEGLGAAFGHGLGHGLGLEVHEQPWLNQEWPSTLQVGNVCTVEPGAYLPGRGGVRIEDLVIVTEDGSEVLTPFTKEPVTVG
ncbi:MAG TPA: Xaa-Pro peptidase family protein [Gaiellaceae bacterium]|jgi:Xaa-Pro aminopeptidase|nr:Xaa-Pro peptidase family protein [Gaiellaceae bacterium]